MGNYGMANETVKKRIEDAMSNLIGQPMWACRRAADLAAFHFGRQNKTFDLKGANTEVGDYALHVQCPWRIVRDDRVIVGSGDLYYSADISNEQDSAEFDWDRNSNRRDELIRLFFENGSKQFAVQRIAIGTAGSVQILLQERYFLEIFPDKSLAREQWRLLKPDSGEPHFILTGAGIEV